MRFFLKYNIIVYTRLAHTYFWSESKITTIDEFLLNSRQNIISKKQMSSIE